MVEEISGAEGMLTEGEGFFRVVEGSHRKPEVFTPEIVHNLLCMAMEKFAMSILLRMGVLPDNHTFSDLVTALKQHIPIAGEVEEALLTLDEESDLCSLEIRRSRIPPADRMLRLEAIGVRLREAAVEVVRGGNLFPLQLEASPS